MWVARCLPLFMAMSFVPLVGTFAGDAGIPAEKVDRTEKQALEERVRQLEERVRELEALLQRRDRPAVPQDPFGFRNNPNRNARDIFEEMRREMEKHFGNLEGWSDLDEGIPRGTMANRPRLGVDMRPLSADLKERYKNDVKEGVFIVSIVPNTPAEHAGLHVGDAVTSFAGKAIKEPADLQEAVRSAAPGKYEVGVVRRGEALTLSVDLGQVEAPEPPPVANRGGWLRRGDMEGLNPNPGEPGAPAPRDARRQSRTEVKASALELSDALSAELKLNDEQKKKMDQVLAAQRQALNEAVSNKTERTQPRRGGMTFHFGGDLNQLVEKHAKDAETELSGTLSPEQLRQWGEWRKRNSSVSVNQSISIESGKGPVGGTRPDTSGF